ncbi:hypothetical protein D9M72_356650 [compost metagenome]
MRLKVAFKDHVEAKLVRQRQEVRVRRIVRGPDGVDVVLLHQPELTLHDIPGHHAAELGMVFVAVDASEQDPLAVHLELGILDTDGAEAELHRGGLPRGADSGVVQPRQFCRPRLDAREPTLLPGGHFQPQFRDAHDGGSRLPCPARLYAEDAFAAAMVIVSVDEDVVEPLRRPRLQRHIPEDAGQPPHVLVFHIAGCRELRHLDCKHVPSRYQHTRGIEFVGEPAAACGAKQGAVQPHSSRRLYAVEADHG